MCLRSGCSLRAAAVRTLCHPCWVPAPPPAQCSTRRPVLRPEPSASLPTTCLTPTWTTTTTLWPSCSPCPTTESSTPTGLLWGSLTGETAVTIIFMILCIMEVKIVLFERRLTAPAFLMRGITLLSVPPCQTQVKPSWRWTSMTLACSESKEDRCYCCYVSQGDNHIHFNNVLDLLYIYSTFVVNWHYINEKLNKLTKMAVRCSGAHRSWLYTKYWSYSGGIFLGLFNHVLLIFVHVKINFKWSEM